MYRVMEHVSDYMLLRAERSMDLLMGIIVIVGWYHYHCLVHAQLNTLVSLACTLASELGLNRQPMVSDVPMPGGWRGPATIPRTNEERRAFAGVWFLSST